MVLAGIVLAFALVSCGGEPAKEVTVTLKIVGSDEGDPVLDTQVTVKAANPSVLDAFITACDENEIPYVLSDDNASVKDIQDFTNLRTKTESLTIGCTTSTMWSPPAARQTPTRSTTAT